MGRVIGLTYDLRKDYLKLGYSEEETAEFDSEETIEFLADAITSLGHTVVRIGNIFALTRRLADGEKWDLVFNITEGMYGRSREAQVPALLEAFNIPYTFSDTLTLALALDKAMTKSVVKDAGVPTPAFALIESEQDIKKVRLPYPLFVKPVSEGTGKGITPDSIIRDEAALDRKCRELLANYRQPVLVETYLSGREFTVGIIGTGEHARAVGVLEVKLLDNAEPNVYSYINKEQCEERVLYTLVRDEEGIISEASAIALGAYRALQCRDAGRVDLRADGEGRINFIEINPLAGMHPSHSDLPILCIQAGMKYEELISAIIESAMSRMNK